MNEVFKLVTNLTDVQHSTERYFIVDKRELSRQTSSNFMTIRSFWKSIEKCLMAMTLSNIISELQIENILREQSIEIQFISNKLVLKTVGALKIHDLINRMEAAIVNQHFTIEQRRAEITRTISATDCENNNETLISDHDLSSEWPVTILPPIDSLMWNCNCHKSAIVSPDTNMQPTQWPISNVSIIINMSMIDIEVYPHKNASFLVICDGEPKPIVKWFFKNQQLQSSDKYKIEVMNSTYAITIYNCTNLDVGQYRVSVENSFQRIEESAMLNVKMKPQFVKSLTIEHQYCIIGQNVELFVKFRGIEKPKISWFFNGQPVMINGRLQITESDDEISVLQIRESRFTDIGVYTIRAKNSMGEAEFQTTLSVLGTKPTIINDLIGEVIASKRGQNVQIELVVSGIPKPNIIWMRGNREIIFDGNFHKSSSTHMGNERYQLTIENIKHEDNDEYWAKLENLLGVTHSNKCHISIIDRLNNIPAHAKWSSNPTIVINNLSQYPSSLAIDQQSGTIYVSDWWKKRIVIWTPGKKDIDVIEKNVNGPTGVLISRDRKSIIIADRDNKRVLKWSRDNLKTKEEIIIENIDCFGLGMDDEDALYVTDYRKNVVMRYAKGIDVGVIVAGGNGSGPALHQLSSPDYVAIDSEGSLFVSDCWNHRIVKWKRNAEEGIVVAGFKGRGSKNTQLNQPRSIIIDAKDNLYIADENNNRVVRYQKNAKEADILIDSNQLTRPFAIAFDRQNNLYVGDHSGRVIRFLIYN